MKATSINDVLLQIHRAKVRSDTISMVVTKMQMLVNTSTMWVADINIHHDYLEKMKTHATKHAVYVDNLMKLGNSLHDEFYTIIESIHETRPTLKQHLS